MQLPNLTPETAPARCARGVVDRIASDAGCQQRIALGARYASGNVARKARMSGVATTTSPRRSVRTTRMRRRHRAPHASGAPSCRVRAAGGMAAQAGRERALDTARPGRRSARLRDAPVPTAVVCNGSGAAAGLVRALPGGGRRRARTAHRREIRHPKLTPEQRVWVAGQPKHRSAPAASTNVRCSRVTMPKWKKTSQALVAHRAARRRTARQSGSATGTPT